MIRILKLFTLFVLALALPAVAQQPLNVEQVQLVCAQRAEVVYSWGQNYRPYVDKASIKGVMYQQLIDKGVPFPDDVKEATLKGIDYLWDQPLKPVEEAASDFFEWCRARLNRPQ